MISIVIVNWNGHADTVECLASLLHSRVACEVVVCDNRSEASSFEAIRHWCGNHLNAVATVDPLPARAEEALCWRGTAGIAHLSLLRLRENYGFAGGNNVGVEYARSRQPEFVFLLNNDTLVEPTTLDAFIARMNEADHPALCGATLVLHGDRDHCQALGGDYDFLTATSKTLFRRCRVDQLPPRSEVESKMKYVIGAAMFFRSEVLFRLGGLSEDYFLYYEELDVSQRLLPEERMSWAPEAIVYHKVGASIGTAQSTRSSDLAIYFDQRSRMRFYRNHLPTQLPFAFAKTIWTLAAYGRKLDLRALRSVVWGTIDSFTGRMRLPTHFRRMKSAQ